MSGRPGTDLDRPPPSDAKVILIPKQLRMEWTDVLALDNSLSHVAFRVACVIGSHFNRHHGDTYVKQETIAAVMGVSDRTTWSAIKELEHAGYLIVERRELGVRASDGRRVCGGRGVANTYRPAFERSQLSATNNGRMLAARCDHYWGERSQNRARKVATDCDPTLTSPSGKNLTRARGRSATGVDRRTDAPDWQGADEHLRRSVGDDVFESWFAGVKAERRADGGVGLLAPTRFIADTIRMRFSDELLRCWQAIDPRVRAVEVTHGSERAVQAERGRAPASTPPGIGTVLALPAIHGHAAPDFSPVDRPASGTRHTRAARVDARSGRSGGNR